MFHLTLRQAVYAFGCIPLCIIGLLGNIFSLLVLYPSKYNQTKAHTADLEMRNVSGGLQGLFYGYLGVLSVTDIIWLLTNLVFRSSFLRMDLGALVTRVCVQHISGGGEV